MNKNKLLGDFWTYECTNVKNGFFSAYTEISRGALSSHIFELAFKLKMQ